LKGGDTWAITSYYGFDDPGGDKRRLRAYREFRRHLQLPLAVVELSPEGAFDLGPDDAELLIQLRSGDILWQKERLLNIALEALPSECEAVVWTDCDVVLTRKDWPSAVRQLLGEFHLVQPFHRLHFLPEDTRPDGQIDPGSADCHYSAAFRLHSGTIRDEYFQSRGGTGIRLKCSGGMIWAARRETLKKHGIYDCLILGGGDKALLSAACGRYEDLAKTYQMNPREHRHYESWARRFFHTVGGKIGYVEGDALHLWHGELSLRHYSDRYSGFDQFQFDPNTDLIRSADGAWRWASDKPKLHAFVRRYFERRQGPPRSATLA